MADTRQIRARRGPPVAYALRVFVIVYLTVLVIWPLYESASRRSRRPRRGAEAGFGAFMDRLTDPR